MSVKFKGKIGNSCKYLPPALTHAYNSYSAQVNRCTSKKCKSYENYGAKGIKIKYSRLELVQWVYNNINDLENTNFVIGRIDHKKDYSLDNLRIETISFSVKERNNRAGHPSKYKQEKTLVLKNDVEIMTSFSRNYALEFAGLKTGNSKHYLENKTITRNGYSFRSV